MRLNALLLTALAIAPNGMIASQNPAAISSGDRVRVTTPSLSGGPFVGTVGTLDNDSLVVQGAGDPRRLALGSVTHLELSRGLKSNARRGAGIGFLLGAGVGAAIGSGCDTYSLGFTKGQCIAGAAIILGVGGGLAGGITGALIRTERWAEVSLDRLRMSFTPHTGGLRLNASLLF